MPQASDAPRDTSETKDRLRKLTSTRIPIPLVVLGLAAVSFPTWWSMLRSWTRPPGGNADPTTRQIHEVVREVKEELARADSVRMARNEQPLFLLGYFDLDLKFTVSNSDKSHGQASPAFVVVGSEESIERERVQEIHLHFVAPPERTHRTSANIGGRATSDTITDIGLPPPENRP